MVFHLQVFQAAGRLQWCDQKGQYRSAWGCGWRNLMWGFPVKLNLFFPSRVKVNSAVQTHLYSATRGYKWYFLFLTNMNTVFALKTLHFSWKIFPPFHLSPRCWILLGRWTVQEGGHAAWERVSAWDMGHPLFFWTLVQVLLILYGEMQMAKKKCSSKLLRTKGSYPPVRRWTE